MPKTMDDVYPASLSMATGASFSGTVPGKDAATAVPMGDDAGAAVGARSGIRSLVIGIVVCDSLALLFWMIAWYVMSWFVAH